MDILANEQTVNGNDYMYPSILCMHGVLKLLFCSLFDHGGHLDFRSKQLKLF